MILERKNIWTYRGGFNWATLTYRDESVHLSETLDSFLLVDSSQKHMTNYASLIFTYWLGASTVYMLYSQVVWDVNLIVGRFRVLVVLKHTLVNTFQRHLFKYLFQYNNPHMYVVSLKITENCWIVITQCATKDL